MEALTFLDLKPRVCLVGLELAPNHLGGTILLQENGPVRVTNVRRKWRPRDVPGKH